MSDPQALRESLRAFVQENFLYMRPTLQFADDDSLLKRGVMDSLGVLEIVGFMEERWNLKIDEADITEANFGTIESMVNYLKGREIL